MCILDNSSETCLLQSVACIFLILTVSFIEQRFFFLIYQFFPSWVMPLLLNLASDLLTQGHLNFILCLLLRFYSLHFTFRFVNHFELIFVSRLLFFFWHMYVQLFSTIC